MALKLAEIDLEQVGAIKQARATLAQTGVLDPAKIRPDSYLNSVERTEKQKLIEGQSELIRKQLKRALLDEPNFILFPELSIPWELQSELREWAIKEKVYVIGGLTYGPDYQNACAVFPPFERDALPPQYKVNRAPAEDEHVKTGQSLLIFKNSGFGTFASVICYDFTSLGIGKEIRDHNVNLLFWPTLNRSVRLFDDLATGQCYSLYSYICLCNSASFGNSASYGPVRKVGGSVLQQERVIGKIVGAQETTLTTELDVAGLIDSIDRFKNGHEVLTGFITPPADIQKPGVLVSPYTPLGPAKENFVGRADQIDEFWARIESNTHVLLLGPSGTGKTSLIYRLRAETPLEFRTGFIEVYDTEGTFDFFRRLSSEITSMAEPEKRSLQFKETLQRALEDIKKTRDAVSEYGFEASQKALVETFHHVAQAIDAQKLGKIVIFIDQAERLAWLEEDLNYQRYAVRILIQIMQDLERMGSPVLFALAIRQHDYDPLIALASNHLPARVVPLQKFTKEDAILAVEKPLPPEISIEPAVSSKIAELSNGIPFFVQLLADAVFKELGQEKVITEDMFDGLHIRTQRDIFPLLMNALTPNEQHFVEAMGMGREYTVKMEDIVSGLNIDSAEFRHITNLLLGKNIIESLENDRFRFVHDQMKGFIQREWLAAKMSNLEKLHSETETALQMLFLAPEDEITVSFNILPLAMCCFKSLMLTDVKNLFRALEQIATLNYENAADLCSIVTAAAYRCLNQTVFENLRSKLVPPLEDNKFYEQASAILAIEVINGEHADWKTAQRAIDLQEKIGIEYKDWRDFVAMGYYMVAVTWATTIGDFQRKDILLKKFLKILSEVLQRLEESEMDILYWPEIEYGRVRGSVSKAHTHSWLYEAAQWTGKMGNLKEQNELLERAINQVFVDAEEKDKMGDFFAASTIYATGADCAEKLGDEKRRRELYERAITLITSDTERRGIQKSWQKYEQAADWAEKLGDEKRRREFYEKAIAVILRGTEGRDFIKDGLRYEQAADWAGKIGDEKSQREFYEKAIALILRGTEGRYHIDLWDRYEQAADWAGKIGDEKSQREFYETAIELLREQASAETERGNLSSASAYYVQAARWADAIGDYAKRERLYEKAAQILREAAEVYEKQASLLLNADTLEAASALRDYYAEDEEKYAYFGKIASIVEHCRRFFRDYSRTGQW